MNTRIFFPLTLVAFFFLVVPGNAQDTDKWVETSLAEHGMRFPYQVAEILTGGKKGLWLKMQVKKSGIWFDLDELNARHVWPEDRLRMPERFVTTDYLADHDSKHVYDVFKVPDRIWTKAEKELGNGLLWQTYELRAASGEWYTPTAEQARVLRPNPFFDMRRPKSHTKIAEVATSGSAFKPVAEKGLKRKVPVTVKVTGIRIGTSTVVIVTTIVPPRSLEAMVPQRGLPLGPSTLVYAVFTAGLTVRRVGARKLARLVRSMGWLLMDHQRNVPIDKAMKRFSRWFVPALVRETPSLAPWRRDPHVECSTTLTGHFEIVIYDVNMNTDMIHENVRKVLEKRGDGRFLILYNRVQVLGGGGVHLTFSYDPEGWLAWRDDQVWPTQELVREMLLRNTKERRGLLDKIA